MRYAIPFIVLMAVVIMAAAFSGCTSTTPPPAATTRSTPMPAPTTAMTPVATPTATPTIIPLKETSTADTQFLNGMEACYAATPVISNITTHDALVACLQTVPQPQGQCALNYQGNVLRYLKDDFTTAGYNRQNTRIRLAREAYSRGMTYNYVTGQDDPCSPQPTGLPITGYEPVIPTGSPVPVPTLTPTPVPAAGTADADKPFMDGMQACYARTPVITNITTHNALVACLQTVPNPQGVCAQDLQDNVLRYLKDDYTTAGYNRENTRIRLATEAFNQGLNYNYVTNQNEPCSPVPLGNPLPI